MITLDDLSLKIKCLMVNNNDSWPWHKRATHIHMEHLNKLVKRDLVIGLPKINYVMLVKKENKSNKLSSQRM